MLLQRYTTVLVIGVLPLLAGCERTMAPPLRVNEDNVRVLVTSLDVDRVTNDLPDVPLADPTGFADLTGVFRVVGSPPARRPLSVTSDHAVCAPGGRAPLDERVVVGPDNGLKNVLIFLNTDIPDDDLWIHEPTYGPDREAVVEFDQKECIFLSHVFPIRTTQTMRILNSDPVGHNTNISPRRGASPFNQTIPAGGSVSHQPGGQSPDPFSVTCSIHPWMRAYMITRANPYFAVTDENGEFSIPKVPAGVKLEFRVWQETSNYLQDVTVNGQPEKWSKGRFTLELEPDTSLNLEVDVDAAKFQ